MQYIFLHCIFALFLSLQILRKCLDCLSHVFHPSFSLSVHSFYACFYYELYPQKKSNAYYLSLRACACQTQKKQAPPVFSAEPAFYPSILFYCKACALHSFPAGPHRPCSPTAPIHPKHLQNIHPASRYLHTSRRSHPDNTTGHSAAASPSASRRWHSCSTRPR